MLVSGNGGDLPVGYAHRAPQFLTFAHQFTVHASRKVVETEHALIECKRDESLESVAKPRTAFAIRQDAQSVSDLTDGDC